MEKSRNEYRIGSEIGEGEQRFSSRWPRLRWLPETVKGSDRCKIDIIGLFRLYLPRDIFDLCVHPRALYQKGNFFLRPFQDRSFALRYNLHMVISLLYLLSSSSFYRKIWIYPYILILILIHNLTKEYKKKNLNFKNSVLVYRIIQYYFLIYIIQVSLRGFFYIWTMHIFCMVKRIDVYWVSRVIYNLWILTRMDSYAVFLATSCALRSISVPCGLFVRSLREASESVRARNWLAITNEKRLLLYFIFLIFPRRKDQSYIKEENRFHSMGKNLNWKRRWMCYYMNLTDVL